MPVGHTAHAIALTTAERPGAFAGASSRPPAVDRLVRLVVPVQGLRVVGKQRGETAYRVRRQIAARPCVVRPGAEPSACARVTIPVRHEVVADGLPLAGRAG